MLPNETSKRGCVGGQCTSWCGGAAPQSPELPETTKTPNRDRPPIRLESCPGIGTDPVKTLCQRPTPCIFLLGLLVSTASRQRGVALAPYQMRISTDGFLTLWPSPLQSVPRVIINHPRRRGKRGCYSGSVGVGQQPTMVFCRADIQGGGIKYIMSHSSEAQPSGAGQSARTRRDLSRPASTAYRALGTAERH